MGVCNLLCGVAVGISGSNAAFADAADPGAWPKALIGRSWLTKVLHTCSPVCQDPRHRGVLFYSRPVRIDYRLASCKFLLGRVIHANLTFTFSLQTGKATEFA